MSEPCVLQTRIDRVTVHRNGALVVRAGTLTPAAEPAFELRIPGLPLLFQSDTVRVRLDHPALIAGPVEELAELGGEPERQSELQREREALEVELARLREEDGAWARLGERVGGLAVSPEPDLSPRARARWPDLDAWSALSDAAADASEQVAAARAELRGRVRAVSERLEALERRRLAERPEAARVTRTLRTVLRRAGEAAPPEVVGVEVEYFVAAARWAPAYALDLDAAGGARLQLAAWVGQASGEDWAGARVAVSTADLRRTAALPKLAAWKIGRAAAPPSSGWRPLPEDLDGLFRDADQAGPRPAPPPPPKPPPTPKKAPAPQPAPAPPVMEVAARPVPLGAPPPSPPAPSAMMPPPGAAPAPKRARAGVALSRAQAPLVMESAAPDEEELEEGFAEGGAPPPQAPAPLGPGRLLDYAWLRLPRWDEPGRRGRLWPVDASADLRALAEERGDTARVQQLERALAALREAEANLRRAPLPPGCVSLEGSTYQYRYPFGPRVSVPCDGRFVQVPVAEGRAPSATVFRVVPRQAPTAFRTVRLENPLGAPLPAGPVRVTDRGDVRAAGTLGPVGAGGRISIDLGVEEGLRIARNATYQEVEKGMLSAQSVGTNTVRTELASRLDQPATVQIFERLPLAPEGGELVVALESASREPTRDLGPSEAREEGALRWEIVVPPRAKAEITYAYTVRLPSRLEVVGGARREP